MLTQSQHESFATDGYLVVRQLCAESVLEPVRRLIDRYVDVRICALHAAGQIDDLYADTPFAERWALAARDYNCDPERSSLSRNWGQSALLDRAIYDLLTDPSLLDLVADLIGPEITANGDFWVRPKIPNDPSTTFAYHQDSFYYAGAIWPELRVLSVWLPLVDACEENGCLSFIPASHRYGAIPYRDTGTGQREPIEPIATYGQPQPEPVQVGDVIAFDHRTLHASGHNTTENQVRWSIDLRYMPTGQSYAWHVSGDDFDTLYPGFVARSADPERVWSWEDWRNRPRSE